MVTHAVRQPIATIVLAVATTAAVLAALLVATLPPRARHLAIPVPKTIVTGGYHLHTVRSDGSGTVDEVAAAAARAGLAFIIVTDHGDARRRPDPPSYKDGVLYIDAVEISTTGGHIVALGFTDSAPYPLAGEPRDVLEDIHRLGGIAIVAHPDSASPGLRYLGSDDGFDGIEWLNVDSEWRDKSPARLVAAAGHYLFRGQESIASLFERPAHTIDRWDRVAAERPVFGMAALDTHARIGWRARQEPRTGHGIHRPTYEDMFRTLAQSVVLDAPLSGDAAADARRVIDALTRGHSFSIVRAIADPASLTFTATQTDRAGTMGDRLPDSPAPTVFQADVPQAPEVRVALFRDGREIAAGPGRVRVVEPAAHGVYRVEVSWPGARVPWLMSNPITVGLPLQAQPAAPARVGDHLAPMSIEPAAWAIEREPRSIAAVRRDGSELRFDFVLGSGAPHGQYAAIATPLASAPPGGQIVLTARSSSPMRASVQLRAPGGRDGVRWRRSVYLDPTPRSIVVPFDDFTPVDAARGGSPDLASVTSLLVVVDTMNTTPGAGGTIWISNVAVAR